MDSIVSIVTPTDDRALLTIQELRDAADVSDRSQDADLRALGLRVANRIAYACRIRRGGAVPATLRQETILETFRERHHIGLGRWPRRLRLARRPIISVSSLTHDGVTQDTTNLLIDASAGMIEWYSGRGAFYGNTIAVQYVAGWDIVPDDLKLAATMLVQQYLAAQDQEPGLRSINVPEVIERQWWIGQPTDPDLPQNLMDMLAPYWNGD
jgi:hypothetical protein